MKLLLQQSIKKMNKYLVTLIISLSLFFVSNSADGFQSSKSQDVPVELMPKKQKYLCVQYVNIKNKYYENSKNKTINAVVKKETAAGLTKDFTDLQNNINEDIANHGVKDWVGTVVVNSSSISLYVYLNKHQLIHFTISTTGMNKEVLDTVEILTSGNLVKFSIESTKEVQLKFRETRLTSGHLCIGVKPSNLTSLVPVK